MMSGMSEGRKIDVNLYEYISVDIHLINCDNPSFFLLSQSNIVLCNIATKQYCIVLV